MLFVSYPSDKVFSWPGHRNDGLSVSWTSRYWPWHTATCVTVGGCWKMAKKKTLSIFRKHRNDSKSTRCQNQNLGFILSYDILWSKTPFIQKPGNQNQTRQNSQAKIHFHSKNLANMSRREHENNKMYEMCGIFSIQNWCLQKLFEKACGSICLKLCLLESQGF